MATEIELKVITPRSFNNPQFKDYEYYLVWIGRKGNELSLLFTDFERDVDVEGEVINSENSTNTRTLVSSETDSIIVIAEDLNKDEYDLYRSVLSSSYVWRELDGVRTRVAVKPTSYNFRNSNYKYQLAIELIEPQKAVMK